MPLGLLRECMDYALNDNARIEGVFQAVKDRFRVAGGRAMLATLSQIYNFRNTRVAHQEKEVTNAEEARTNLVCWINGLKALVDAGDLGST
jgi:type III restriction enzyme